MTQLGTALGIVDAGADVEMQSAGGKKKSAFEAVQDAVTKVVREGYSATQILIQVRFKSRLPF